MKIHLDQYFYHLVVFIVVFSRIYWSYLVVFIVVIKTDNECIIGYYRIW